MAAISWKLAGKGQRALGAADGDDLVFDGLAQHFQDARAELGQLIQEEHAAVRQRDLAGVRPVAAAHQPGVADGVVRGAEGAVADQRHIRRELVGHGVDARHIQGFVDGHARQDARQGARQQGLAGAGRTDHQDVVPAGRGHFQGALDVLLAFDLAENRSAGCRADSSGVTGGWGVMGAAPRRWAYRLARDATGITSRSGIRAASAASAWGTKMRLKPCWRGRGCHGQHAAHVAHAAIQRELAHHQRLVQALGWELPGGDQHPQGDGQVVGRAFLAHRSRRQVDGQALARVMQARRS